MDAVGIHARFAPAPWIWRCIRAVDDRGQLRSPLGRHLAFGNDSVEIVGVVADVPTRDGVGGGYGPVDDIPGVYVPAAQFGSGGFRMVHAWFDPKWVVRAAGSHAEISRAIEQAIAASDPQLPIAEFRAMDEVRSDAFGLQRVETILLGSLAALALLLAAVGVYGPLAGRASSASGLRCAVRVGGAVVGAARSGIALAAGGVATGAVLAWWAGRLVRSLLWGLEATGRLTFVGAGSILLTVAVLASLAPALRIVRIKPAVTLSEE